MVITLVGGGLDRTGVVNAASSAACPRPAAQQLPPAYRRTSAPLHWQGNAGGRMKMEAWTGAHMNLNDAAKRVSSIPPSRLPVLACVSEGMSNRQIADKLGYKNGHSVATVVYEIAKQLGIEGMYSRTEKRQFTADAYRQAKRNVSKSLSLDVGKLEDDRAIPIRGPSGSKLRALLRQGYEVERVEVILRLRTGG